MIDEMNMINEKVSFYLKKKSKVHITKADDTWLNGFFIEKESANVYSFKDDKFGLMHLFLFEIKKIEDFREG